PFCSSIKKTSRTTSSKEVKLTFQVLPPSSVLSTVPLPPAAQPRSELIKKTDRSQVIVPAVCLVQLPSCAVVVAATRRHRKTQETALRADLNIGLIREAEDSCETQHISEAHDLLPLLELVSGHQDLIARGQKSIIRRVAFVDRRDVYHDRCRPGIGPATQHDHLALVAGCQHAAGFRQRLSDGHAVVHQANTRLSDVAHYAVTIRPSLIKRDCHLRIDDVLVVSLFDEFRYFFDRLAIDENAAW